MSIDAQFVGIAQLRAKLKRLGDVGAGQALATALTAAAQPIQNEAKRRAPYLSGTLRRGITTVEISRGPRRAVVAISTSNIPYARIHEFGGTIKPAKGKKFLKFKGKDGNDVFVKSVTLPARPYLRPAFDTKKSEATREFGEALRILIEQAL